ncbi:MAG: hypothetical protein Q9227_001204 [Pyrenula ochraceoflavens]
MISGAFPLPQVVLSATQKNKELLKVSSLIANISQDLLPLLSGEAQIYHPGSVGYKNATTRWATAVSPGFDVIVKVAAESDVQQTILYANSQEKPFLAIGGGHGSSSALKSAQGAIGIWMRGLNGTALAPGSNGSQAIIQAGSLAHEVISDLWDLGKQAVAGGCDCTSFVGPMLGGGHGILQGQYGLLADNMISARVVLGNGSIITVSNTSHSDLYWGLKGAGHNFGIVTSFHYQIHDRVPGMDMFATANYTFTQDKLEAVFTIANQWLTAPHRPVNLMHYGLIAINPSLSPQPIVTLLVYWQGLSIPPSYTAPLTSLNPLTVVHRLLDLRHVNSLTNADSHGSACLEGMGRQLFPTSHEKTWSLPNLRAVLDLFAAFPPELRDSTMMLEAYPVNRVQAIPGNNTAYPDRGRGLLASPLLAYPPGNARLDAEVEGWGRRIRRAMMNGTGEGELVAYVNYAHGDEGNEAVYGYEGWRRERLRGLKRVYDPEERFRFFEPVGV